MLFLPHDSKTETHTHTHIRLIQIRYGSELDGILNGMLSASDQVRLPNLLWNKGSTGGPSVTPFEWVVLTLVLLVETLNAAENEKSSRGCGRSFLSLSSVTWWCHEKSTTEKISLNYKNQNHVKGCRYLFSRSLCQRQGRVQHLQDCSDRLSLRAASAT